MASVFAGFVLGYAFSLLFTAFASVMLIGARSRVPYLAKAIAPNISPVMLAVPVSIAAFLGWTLIGLLLGMAYEGARGADGGLGSPSWPFTLGILLAGAAFLAVVLYAWRRLPWQAAFLAAVFVAVFGWALPHLAEAAD